MSTTAIDDDRIARPVRPTAERMAKGDIIKNEEMRGERPKPWQSVESVQDELLAGALISKRAWEAANAFQRMYFLANGSGMAASSMTPPVDGSSKDISKAAGDAKLSVARWSRELAPTLFECLESVIGVGKAPSRWARDAGHHPACGRLVLIAALEQFGIDH